MIMLLVANFIVGLIAPVDTVALLWANEPSPVVLQALTMVGFVTVIVVIGIVADITPGAHITRQIDRLFASLPIVGTIYSGARHASEIAVSDKSDQFRDVKLVEFPMTGSYILGFVTAASPEVIAGAADEPAMTTVMVPLAPNPATNGIILHVSADRIQDVDLTVDQAVQTFMTLGMAIEDDEEKQTDLASA